MKNICIKNQSKEKHIKEGLRILAKIIVRKHINENIKKEGDGENEKHYSRKLICNQ